jgi:hypothetical protein
MPMRERKPDSTAWATLNMNIARGFMSGSLEERGRIFANALFAVRKNSQRRAQAELLLDFIRDFWNAEQNLLLDGEDRDRPDVGVLKGIGYSLVGGIDREQRRWLLDELMTARTLPPIKDKGYMAEWGLPMSDQRIAKCISVLRNLAWEKRQSGESPYAVLHWEDDIQYLHEKWGR